MTPADAQELVRTPNGMDDTQAGAFLDLLMGGALAPEAGGALLAALAERGETATELAAFVRGLRARALGVDGPDHAVDCCGTGGSGRTRFNISTTAAVVVAACGIPVAKHGNKGSKRPNGSFDLLEVLEVPLALPPAACGDLLVELGLVFLFARAHHPTVKAVVPYRQAAGGRTIFNLAGPLANPATVRNQVVGVCDHRTADVVAAALADLGTGRSLVVTGEPGWDEFAIDDRNRLLEVDAGGVTERWLDQPLHPDLDGAGLPGGDAPENAALFTALLDGTETGPLHDLVCLAAGALIDTARGETVTGRGPGFAQAAAVLASGAAKDLFERYRAKAQALAG